jgi:ABC-type nitrate/sulfonate/bicarbonate transport system permease component
MLEQSKTVQITPATSLHEQTWKWGLRILSLCLTAGVWEAVGRAQQNLLFPSFSGTVLALAKLLTQPEFWQALGVSNQALGLGYGLALLVGIPLGLALGRLNRVDKALNIYLSVLLVTPVAALIPLLISLSGLGLVSRVLVVFIFALPFILTNTRTGVKQVEPHLIEMAHSFGATEPQIWLKVLLPGAWPTILTGLRIGLGRAITGMVLAEFLLSAEGLGKLLLEYQGTFEAASVYAVMLAVVFESLVLLRLVKLAERRFGRATSGVVV